MSCWPRSREFSTGGHGAKTGACRPRPSRTLVWTGCGRGGSKGRDQVSVVMKVSQSNAHVMVHCVGDAYCKTEPEQSLCQAQHVEVAVAAEEPARNRSPDQSRHNQRKIWQVG